MKSQYKHPLWFCLVAYLWTATGMSDAASLNTLVNQHGRGSIVVETAADAQLIVHHVGHRDAHEPHAIDAEDRQYRGDTIHGHSHADHVLNLERTKPTNRFLAKDLKVPKFSNGELLAVAPAIDQLHSGSTLFATPTVGPSRNSALAFVKLAQLRL